MSSNREKNNDQSVRIAVFNPNKELLFCKRKDDQKWVLPGGSLKPDEEPTKGAIRELLEETSIKPTDIEYLGDNVIPEKAIQVYNFKVSVDQEPTNKSDPDDEIDSFKWVNIENGLPKDIKENLHFPLYDTTLQLLGLQEDFDKSEKIDTFLDQTVGLNKEFLNNVKTLASIYQKEIPKTSSLDQAMSACDGDPELAAFYVFDIEPNEEKLDLLRCLKQFTVIAKAEISDEQIDVPNSVSSFKSEGEALAKLVEKAFKDGFAYPIKWDNNPKHSKGAILVKEQTLKSAWLLKPGSGKLSPAAGVREGSFSQSQREAAFYNVSKAFGLSQYIPECELLFLDDKEYACIKLLPWSYKTAQVARKNNPEDTTGMFKQPLEQGTLHKLAIMLYLLGEADAHGGNCMVNTKNNSFFLIDHGSSFALEPFFDPGSNKSTFIPFFLRYNVMEGFNKLSPEDKLKALPRIHPIVEKDLRHWFNSLNLNIIKEAIKTYNIGTKSVEARYEMIKVRAMEEPMDLTINQLWTLPKHVTNIIL